MSETSLSLLDRLRDAPQGADWQRLVEIYTPLVRGWLKRHPLLARDDDCDDVVQEVMAVLVRKVPDFRREPRTGAFRRWLRTMTVNCLRDYWRKNRRHAIGSGESAVQELLGQLQDETSDMSRLWDEQHDQHVTRQLLSQIRGSFESRTWKAFERVALEGASPDEVAAELGLSVNAVFIAKSRVLSRLRQESQGLVD